MAQSGSDTWAAGFQEIDLTAQKAGESAEEAGHKAHESESLWGELWEKLKEGIVELGLTIGAWEALKEAIEVDAEIQRTSIALEHLTGSAAAANEIIEQMEELAKEDAIAFPALLPAAQRMVAVGIALEDIKPLMDAAANASWALGTSLESVTGKLEGMILSGMASGRQLRSLGLSSEDMAKVMGVSADQVKTAFKNLDIDTRTEVMEAALKKFAGTAKAEAEGISGKWVELKNTWHEVMGSLGKDLEPVTNFLLGATTFATKTLGAFVDLATHGKEAFLTLIDPSRILAHTTGEAGEKAKEAGEHVKALGEESKKAAPSAAELAEKVRVQVAAHEAAKDATAAHKKSLEELANTMRAFTKEFDTKAMADFNAVLRKNDETIVKLSDDLKPVPDMFSVIYGRVNELGDAFRHVNLPAFAEAFRNINIRRLTDELPELTEEIYRTAKAFTGMSDEAQDAWKVITKETIDGVNQIQIAAAQLGFTWSATLRKSAADAKINYAIIAADGASSARDIEAAWIGAEKARQAATLASNGIITQSEKKMLADRETAFKTGASQMVNDWRNAASQIKTSIERDLARAFADIIFDTKNVGRAFLQLGKDVVSIILDVMIKEGIEALIAKLIVSKAVTGAINVAQVTSDAAVAAAGAYAATALIPFVGPALAPAAAATAYGATMAFAPLAAFEMGTDFVPETGLYELHKGERVTPAKFNPAIGTNQTNNNNPITINVYGGNARDTAKQLMYHLKALSPKFSPAS